MMDNKSLLISLAASVAILALVTPIIREDYQAYLSLGPGGFPYDISGWLLANILRPLGRETISITEYDRTSTGGLKDIPQRPGGRPKIGKHPIPHRRTSDLGVLETRQRSHGLLSKLQEQNSKLIEVATSAHERRGPALFIHRNIPTPHMVAESAWREIAHIHDSDGSLHVVLSPTDCAEVIEKGWGERHPLSGRILLPSQYLLVYAPRNESEVSVIEAILKAAIGYMVESKEVV
ncbi:hypothetical protein L873DRAFT_1845769 [Choiromyces venosus 120613-1]|uniref:Luciferase domain-containing protein n=1 Tax=Choiromyces venosus 120613-1 TaxID=1336337 RepID=A0A3N4JFQ3_9PEZI|nr:hypothetical protein L873DRAFT_1845769 [Choiromyces venosus 120613-1]